MADVNAIRIAMAAQVTAYTKLTCLPDMPDQVTPPVAAILPRMPLTKYGMTLDGGLPSMGTQDLNFHVLIIMSRAGDIANVQAQLDGYLGISASVPSVADAFTVNPTLNGAVAFCEATQVDTYGTMEIAGQSYFVARVAAVVGA